MALYLSTLTKLKILLYETFIYSCDGDDCLCHGVRAGGPESGFQEKASRLRLRPGIFRKEYMLMFQPVTICFLDFMSELAWS